MLRSTEVHPFFFVVLVIFVVSFVVLAFGGLCVDFGFCFVLFVLIALILRFVILVYVLSL